MKRQTYLQYLRSRIEFQFNIGLWLEFDVEAPIVIEEPSDADLVTLKPLEHGDLSIVCMKLASLVRKNPKVIAEKLKPYIEQLTGIEKVEVVGGYINISYDRGSFLMNVTLDK